MARHLLFLLTVLPWVSQLSAQTNADRLRKNAVRVDNPEMLTDSVYQLLAPFPIIMVGEMHGTNEPAQFVTGLVKLFASKGDSVQVGLEIPPEQMQQFLRLGTDSSVYQSKFFADPDYLDGRESYAWAGAIAKFCGNPKVRVFFFDMNKEECASYERDSIMYLKIKRQYLQHPTWKLVTLSGNYHNSKEAYTTVWYLRKDEALGLGSRICTLNNFYRKGACRANFGNGLEEKALETPSSAFDTTFDFDNYFYLVSPASNYGYTGFYYTRYVTAAGMVKGGK